MSLRIPSCLICIAFLSTALLTACNGALPAQLATVRPPVETLQCNVSTLSETQADQPRRPADDVFLPVVTGEEATIMLPGGFDVQGHRGARGLKPENTLPSFETALDLGVTTLELDLHFTADQVVVVWHDPVVSADKCHLPAPGDNPPPDPDDPVVAADELRIAGLTYDQLAQYQCDRNPDPARFPLQNREATTLAGDNYRIPMLSEVFDFAAQYGEAASKPLELRENAARVQFNIETKRQPNDPGAIGDDFDGINPGAFEIATVELVETRGFVDRVILQSFDHRSLWAAQMLNADLRLAALTFRGQDLAEYADRGAAIWSPNYEDVTVRLLEQAQELGLDVIPWTVNERNALQALIDLGVDGIITDRPDLLLGTQR